jgi:acetyl-CoA carboxylase biotin carboxyl carrier protein
VTNEEIKELIQIFVASGVAEMEVKRGDNSLRLRSGATASAREVVIAPAAVQASPMTAPVVHAAPLPSPAPPSPPPPSQDYIVKSPIVGTYYESPKPGDTAFVKVGDRIEPGQVLCIIESMKLMNEIESEVSGTVAAKLMENGRPVEYGEALFAIRQH